MTNRLPLAFFSAAILLGTTAHYAMADVQHKQIEFIACYNQIGATGAWSNSATPTWDTERTLTFETHGPGSAAQDNKLKFQSNDTITTATVASVGSTSTTAIFSIEVPSAYFNWLLEINAKYHGVYVQYQYDVADSGAPTLTGFKVGLPPAAEARCASPNPNGS